MICDIQKFHWEKAQDILEIFEYFRSVSQTFSKSVFTKVRIGLGLEARGPSAAARADFRAI